MADEPIRTPEEIVTALDALTGIDPEGDHKVADRLLLEAAPPEVRAAYDRLQDRADWWAFA